MTDKGSSFSHERVRALFRLSSSNGYESLVFGEEIGRDGPLILWRHDVDLDLQAAVKMAEIEADMGVRATYLLMTKSWFYNPFSAEAERAINRLVELGHDVGLHCDLDLPREASVSSPEVERRVDQELALFDKRYPGLFRRVVSFHNPPLAVLNRDFDGFYSCYQERFFGSIKYLSDSNRRWREGPPEDWLDPQHVPRLSILLHPVIWAYSGNTMHECADEFLKERMSRTRLKLIEDDVEVRP